MTWSDLLAITPWPVLSAIIWLLVASLVLYLARTPARQALLQLGHTLYHACRMAAYSLSLADRKLQKRNHEVLLEHGREAAERAVEREFERIEHTVRKELGDYPALHRQVSEAITAIEEDYQNSREVPPSPPGWTEAVEAVAQLPRQDAKVAQLLDSIQKSMEKMEARAIREYREDARKRHRLLSRARPHWQELVSRLSGAEKKVQRLIDRAAAIDRHMNDYAEINRGSDAALRRLSSSSLTQFFVSAFVLVIAVGGAGTIGGMQVADIAALVIILVEISMGLFLMESMRITRLFPVISALEDRLRRRMIWVSLTILVILASVESGLAFMREILIQDEMATAAMLRGDEASFEEPRFLWITTAAQMGLGFILPFALVFVAIPLETFVHSLRTVLGMIAEGLLRAAATVFRVLGVIFRGLGRLLAQIYDVLAFLPLWVEGQVRRMRSNGAPNRDAGRPANEEVT
jgi:hypothetical protein